jgi:glycine/D-amino acid oxidase-like deaminating enzyme
MVSQELSESGFDVLLVDRHNPADGSTAASTALVQYEIDTPLQELRKKIGSANATRAWRRARLAVDNLKSIFDRLGIQAEQRDALYLSGNRLNASQLREECALRKAIGLDVIYLTAHELRQRFGVSRKAALMGFGNLATNPRRAAASFLLSAISLGAKVYAPVEVVDLDCHRNSITVTTKRGPRIRARWLVLATGYEFPKIVPLHGHRITTTWAFATKRQPRKLWPEQCLIWEAAEPYIYLRTTDDGRVVCGGEDAPQTKDPDEDAQMEEKLARLQQKLGRLFPQLDTRAEFAWAASFGETATGLPTIAPVPRHPRCWAALG